MMLENGIIWGIIRRILSKRDTGERKRQISGEALPIPEDEWTRKEFD